MSEYRMVRIKKDVLDEMSKHKKSLKEHGCQSVQQLVQAVLSNALDSPEYIKECWFESVKMGVL